MKSSLLLKVLGPGFTKFFIISWVMKRIEKVEMFVRNVIFHFKRKKNVLNADIGLLEEDSLTLSATPESINLFKKTNQNKQITLDYHAKQSIY